MSSRYNVGELVYAFSCGMMHLSRVLRVQRTKASYCYLVHCSYPNLDLSHFGLLSSDLSCNLHPFFTDFSITTSSYLSVNRFGLGSGVERVGYGGHLLG